MASFEENETILPSNNHTYTTDSVPTNVKKTMGEEGGSKPTKTYAVSPQESTDVVGPNDTIMSDTANSNDDEPIHNNKTSIYLLYDERMTRHQPLDWKPCSHEDYPTCCDGIPEGYTFENPQRIKSIYSKLVALQEQLEKDSPLSKPRFHYLSCPAAASRETILLAHAKEHYDELQQTSQLERDELMERSQVDEDVYYCPDTFLAATLACGGVVECVNNVMKKNASESTRAIALVRPPGHHACQEKSMGFCYFNSVAVAAKHAIASGRANRVAIVDWDVHHGNGTQELTYDDSSILYVSLHRYGHNFFPSTGHSSEVSDGTNMNVAWTYAKMGDVEYAAAFCELILPVLNSYAPDLILISCGLDAAKGDLLGDCEVTPQGYYCMTRSLLHVCGITTPVVVALEGGYNISVIAECMQAVTLALLDEPFPSNSTATEENNTAHPVSPEQHQDTPACHLEAARNALCSFWDSNESILTNQKQIKAGASSCLNRTMEAVETSPLWLNRISFRRFVKNTPERTMHTRAYRQQQQEEAVNRDLAQAMQSMGL